MARTSTIIDRETREAPTGDNVGGITYDPNAFNWPTHSTDGSQRFGTAEAWRLLTIARRTENKVRVGILDQGFLNPTSLTGLSNQTTYHANAPFVDPFRTSPDDIGHGAKVASAAIALPDDGFGGAGSAGPVGEGVNVYTSYDMTSSISALALARRHGAQIANMSYSTKVPATLSWAARPLERATRTLHRSGVLLFAAAGNDDQNINARRCVIRICWEKTWHSPCENDGVICVGGLMWDSEFKAIGSNYGGEHLDIWGPYSILLGPDPTQPTNDASVKYGTSYASPYVAGVAALVWAADPGLSARIEDLDADVVSVSWESDLDGQIAVGASTAVTDLSEGLHEITVHVADSTGLRAEDSRTISVADEAPIVNILSPEYGEQFYQSQSIVLRATTYDPTTASPVRDESVQWYLDGDDRPFAQGHSTSVAGGTLARGTHRIKAVASDGNNTGEARTDFTVYADPAGNIEPTAVIDSPEADELFLADKTDDSTNRSYATVVLCGHGEDPEDGTLEGDSVTWYYRKSGDSIWYPAGNDPGPGLCLNHRLYLEGNRTDYQLRLRVEDSEGTTDSATIAVAVYTLI